MSFNSAMLEQMKAEGLDLDACIRVLKAAERKSDPTNAERQARHRAKKRNTVTVTPVTPPNDKDILTPSGSEKPEPKGSVKKFPAPDGVSDEIWSDFMLSPKRRKAGMSTTAYAGIKNNLAVLAEHGFPPGEMIALAVERGWTTVKLEWVLNDQRIARNERNNAPSPLDQLVAASLGFGAGGREDPPPCGPGVDGPGSAVVVRRIGGGRA